MKLAGRLNRLEQRFGLPPKKRPPILIEFVEPGGASRVEMVQYFPPDSKTFEREENETEEEFLKRASIGQ